MNGEQIEKKAKELYVTALERMAVDTYIDHCNNYVTFIGHAKSELYNIYNKDPEIAVNIIGKLYAGGRVIWELAIKQLEENEKK